MTLHSTTPVALHLTVPSADCERPARTADPRGVRSRLEAAGWPLLMACLCLAAAAPRAPAGQLAPAVQEQLSRLAPSDPATVLFVLEDRADIAGLDQALKARGASRQERHREVVTELQRVAERSQVEILRELRARQGIGQVIGFTPYWILNGIVVRGTRALIEELAARSDVARVEPNVKAELIAPVDGVPPRGREGNPRGIGVTPGLRACRVPEVWYELGINGTGVLVANMDSGVDGDHPALSTRWRGCNGAHPVEECWLDVIGHCRQAPCDSSGHGTHVMGTITGLGAATEDTIGVAWGAQWIACNPIGQFIGPEFDNDILEGFQWLADPDEDPMTVDDVPHAVQNSWGINEGFGGDYVDCDSRWWEAMDNCEAAGVALIFSAGNEGPMGRTIRSPADRALTMYNAFSVGAIDATNYDWPYPIAEFSSRGPTGCDTSTPLKIKPEVVAPGVHVYSSVPGGGYEDGNWDGTSMAGPHVTGIVALICQANPDLEVDAIKQILLDTARDEGTAGEDNTYGFGMVDAYAAVLQSLDPSSSVRDVAAEPGRLLYIQPNPFTLRTTVRFRLRTASFADVAIYDLAGRRVRTLVSSPLPAGEQRIVWDGRDDAGQSVASGVYWSALRVGEGREGRKILRIW